VIRRLLVANRGEIARRVFATCRALGIETVAVYSDADTGAPHLREADRAVRLPGSAPADTYLRGDLLVEAALRAGADAVHPGYGFLSENASFAAAVGDAGLTWVGPPPKAIAAMGSKVAAKQTAAEAGVPVLSTMDPEAVERFPVLVKAAAGGGGRGMRIVRSADALAAELETARREAERSFKDGRVYVERYVERPRHIEVQVLSDRHGNHLHLGERECSVQRRFQKLIEETPSAALDLDTRRRLCDAAVGIARTVGYENAGTVEFIFAPSGEFYFLEMNTRLQVEHPVTEMVTGVDLVAEQIAVANGEPLRLRQDDIRSQGHAIECRICAEDADHGHTPTNGEVALLRPPTGPGVRFDGGLCVGQPITTSFDSMLAKLVVHGSDRPQATLRMRQALRDLVLLGVEHNAAYLERVLAHPGFGRGELHTHFLEEHKDALGARPAGEQDLVGLLAAAALVVRRASLETPEPYASIGPWRN